MDCYKELEISPNATEDEIRKSYKRLALKYHPDKNHDPGAAEKFKRVSEAYQILTDPEKKNLYESQQFEDGEYEQPPSYNRRRAGGYTYFHEDPLFAAFTFQTPDDIFRQFFGGQDPFNVLFNDPVIGGGSGTRVVRDPFLSAFESSSLNGNGFGSFNNGLSSASRSVSTTTSIVNGRTRTITKIKDANGTRIIEDYGDGNQRVTVNGKVQPQSGVVGKEHSQYRVNDLVDSQQKIDYKQPQRQPDPYQMPATSQTYANNNMNGNYGNEHVNAYYQEEQRPHQSPFRQLLSSLCCGLC